MIYFFLTGLCFGGLGLAAYLQTRQAASFPLRNELPFLANFGLLYGATLWVEMFLVSGTLDQFSGVLNIFLIVGRTLSGIFLLRFGWGMFKNIAPLPAWAIFVPGIFIIPLAYVITYASTTFITPSPIEIPIDIWSRYLLYLPGSIFAGIGFLRISYQQRIAGSSVVARLMLGSGIGFLLEALVVGLIVPAAPYGPASYYNYDRVAYNAFIGEVTNRFQNFGLTKWLDYQQVLDVTGISIEFWRFLSALVVTIFVIKGLDVFEELRLQEEARLRNERDYAQSALIDSEKTAREVAEHWSEMLVSINRKIANFGNLDEILVNIVASTRELLHADLAGLSLWDHEQECLALNCMANPQTSEMIPEKPKIDNPILNEVFHNAASYLSSQTEDRDRLIGLCSQQDHPAQQVAAVPIQLVDETTIGVFWISRCFEQQYLPADLVWLESMADQVVIAIQHGIMTGQLQSLSIIEERSRIAREMHDGLAQVLGYLNLQVQTIERLFKQKKHKAMEEEIAHMRTSVLQAQDDIRENILSLRTTLANEQGVVPSIEEYLREFSIQTGIQTTFENETGTIAEDGLSSIVEVQLVCILQEALTNVRKHSHASEVIVELSKIDQQDQSKVMLMVRDDGIGFELKQKRKTFGLQTMQERAVSVNADFSIWSKVNQGTKVTCVFPLVEEKAKTTKVSIFN